MDAARKPRPESKLKNLPESNQAAIAALLKETSLRAAEKQLRAQGIETSRSALSLFLRWWNARQEEARQLEIASKILAKMRSENPNLTTRELSDRARELFMVQAMSLVSDRPIDALKLWTRLSNRLLKGSL